MDRWMKAAPWGSEPEALSALPWGEHCLPYRDSSQLGINVTAGDVLTLSSLFLDISLFVSFSQNPRVYLTSPFYT